MQAAPFPAFKQYAKINVPVKADASNNQNTQQDHSQCAQAYDKGYSHNWNNDSREMLSLKWRLSNNLY